MKVSIAKRAYPMNVAGILKKPILLRSYNAFLKRRMADELLDFVFCKVVMKKSPDFLYWTFIHDASPRQINLGAHGEDLRTPIEEAINAPGRVDYDKLKATLVKVYSRVVDMLDSNFEKAFAESPELEAFALKKTKLTPKIAGAVLDVDQLKWKEVLRRIVLDLTFGDAKKAEGRVLGLLMKVNGKKPSRRVMAKHMKNLERKM